MTAERKLKTLLSEAARAETAVRLALQGSQYPLSQSELALRLGLPIGTVQSVVLGLLAAGSIAAESHYRYRWL